MNAHNRGDDHLHGSIMRSNQTARDPIPHRSPTSANEAMLALNFPILLDNEVMDFAQRHWPDRPSRFMSARPDITDATT
jgi:hypothetical protein